VTAFLDGDRGGDLILKELLQVAKIDYIARAPKGKEVEDLTRKEILKALRSKQALKPSEKKTRSSARKTTTKVTTIKTPRTKSTTTKRSGTRTRTSRVTTRTTKVTRAPIDIPPEIQTLAKGMKEGEEKMRAILIDKNYKVLDRIEVRALASALKERKDLFAVVFDGVITQRLVDITAENKLRYLIGQRIGNVTKKPSQLRIHILSEIK
jgi:DNA primase